MRLTSQQIILPALPYPTKAKNIFTIYFWMEFLIKFALLQTVVVAQLVRASDCDSEGRGFEPHHPPKLN